MAGGTLDALALYEQLVRFESGAVWGILYAPACPMGNRTQNSRRRNVHKMRLPDLRAEHITAFQREWTCRWHDAPTSVEADSLWNRIEQNHRMNFALCRGEEIARRDDLGPERVRDAKRTIDRCNQARNDAVERIDLWILEQLPPAPRGTPLHSETPGMMVDRLSILTLKLYHMGEE